METLWGHGNHLVAELCQVLVDTGMRLGEALGLRWAQVHDGWIHLRDCKNGLPRSIPLTHRAENVLDRLRGVRPVGPFFSLSRHQVRHAWDKARWELGYAEDKEFVPHCLRHTFCSRLVQAGVPLAEVKQLAGHANVTMTMRYAHLAPQNLIDAIEKLEEVHG